MISVPNKSHGLSVIYSRYSRAWCDRCQVTVRLIKSWRSGNLECRGELKRPLAHTLVENNRDGTGVCLWCGPVDLWNGKICPNSRKITVSKSTRIEPHGLTRAQAQALRAGKDCEICGDVGQAVDHDHGTGQVRGVLCHACNIGLGKFEDSPDLIKLAYEYLIRVRGS